MYESKKDVKPFEKPSVVYDDKKDLNIDRAVKILKEQANSYHHAGLTHISSLLE